MSPIDVAPETAKGHRTHLLRINRALGERDPAAITTAHVQAMVGAPAHGERHSARVCGRSAPGVTASISPNRRASSGRRA
jgi:hypothetical protein